MATHSTPAQDLGALWNGGAVAGLSDGDLLARYVAAGGPAADRAFEALVVRHGPLVWGVCRRLLADATDAEDAFQGTFLVLVRRARSVRADRPDALARWLHGVSRRIATRTRADRARRQRRERAGLPVDPPARPPADPHRAETMTLLDAEVARLAEPFRAAVLLCDLGGFTHEAAALAVGCPVGTIKSRLARGRDRLRDRLTRRGVIGADAGLSAAVLQPKVPPPLVAAVVRAAGLPVVPIPAAAATNFDFSPWKGARSMIPGPIAGIVGGALALGLGWLGWTAPDPPPPVAAPAAQSAPVTVPAAPPAETRDSIEVTAEVRDPQTDAPAAGVGLNLLVRPTNQEATATTDAAGLAHFRVDHGNLIQDFNITIDGRDGWLPFVQGWARRPNGSDNPPPTRLVYQLERGITIGGRVLDPAGRPVAGAAVKVFLTRRGDDPEYLRTPNYSRQTYPTDAAGRWSIPNAPADLATIEVGAMHPLHRTRRDSFERIKASVAEALAGSLVITLPARGTDVTGTVLDPAGRPVVGAAVALGTWAQLNLVPPIRTDAQGRFTYGISPGTKTTLTATHPGFGPVGQTIEVGPESQDLRLTLTPPVTLSGSVVSPTGEPIPDALVAVTWKPGGLAGINRIVNSVQRTLITDAAGRFTWPEAPADPVQITVDANGYAQAVARAARPGTEQRIVLRRATLVRGTVVDAATGQPVTDFEFQAGVGSRPGARLAWQRWQASRSLPANPTPGHFEYEAVGDFAEFAIRVDGAEYLSEDSPVIAADGAGHDVTFRLTRGTPVAGQVVTPDGRPASGATINLGFLDHPLPIRDGEFRPSTRPTVPSAKVAPDGSFRLPPQRRPFSVLALDAAGVALLPVGGFQPQIPITLQPWGQVAGTSHLVEPSGAHPSFRSHSGNDQRRAQQAGFAFYEDFALPVDAAGRFSSPRLIPGPHPIVRADDGSAQGLVPWPQVATLDARPGTTTRLALGTGRAVTGTLRLPAALDLNAGSIRIAAVAGLDPSDRTRERGVQIQRDGRFRADDLPPGSYRLTVALHAPRLANRCGWGRLAARYGREFAVEGDRAATPLDLGTLEPVERAGPPLAVGDLAPPLRAVGTTGRGFDLADHRGQVVLVDFWASWCAPCLAEIPTLKAIRAEFGADPRFHLASIAVDEEPSRARPTIQAEGMEWGQAWLDPEAPEVAAFDATAVPATILIGPDGRVIARDLRGDALRTAVRRSLADR